MPSCASGTLLMRVALVVMQFRRARAGGTRFFAGVCWLVDIAVHHAFSIEEDMVEVQQNPFRLAHRLCVRELYCACAAVASQLGTRAFSPGDCVRDSFRFFLMDAYFLQSMILLRRAKRG
jgi:hypothetical protein